MKPKAEPSIAIRFIAKATLICCGLVSLCWLVVSTVYKEQRIARSNSYGLKVEVGATTPPIPNQPFVPGLAPPSVAPIGGSPGFAPSALPQDQSLATAVSKGDTTALKALLAKGVAADTPTTHGLTPLMMACSRGRLDMTQLLLDKSADVNARMPDDIGDGPESGGFTALFFAASKDRVEVMRLLLKRGARVDAKSSDGDTALGWAAAFNHPAAAELRVRNGAKPDVLTKDGISPLLMASSKGFDGVVKVLLKAGADPNQTDKFGETPLSRALLSKHGKVARMLREAGGK